MLECRHVLTLYLPPIHLFLFALPLIQLTPNMEVQQQQQQQQLGLGLGLGFREQDATSSSSLVVGLKLCLPLPSKLTESDVKTENPIQLNNYPNRVSDKSPEALKHAPKILDVSPSGGTRWNPTSEQIAALEALYIGGMRTPSAQVIERITFDLGKYGRIEGKNVFYWFQNHKARERQKQKRSSLLTLAATTTTTTITASQCRGKEVKEWCDPSKKRRCGNWKAQVSQENDGSDGTLELFPLHPEL